MIRKEGPGWRLERDISRKHFPVLIGGEHWAVELSEDEWVSLCKMVFDLIDNHSKLKNQLMKEENIFLEIERSPWWGCIDGDKENWSLKLVLSEDGSLTRGLELFWPIPAAQTITSAMRTMWDSQ